VDEAPVPELVVGILRVRGRDRFVPEPVGREGVVELPALQVEPPEDVVEEDGVLRPDAVAVLDRVACFAFRRLRVVGQQVRRGSHERASG
jgi:hypothetical protein